ncbi:MAG: hypothetical protein JWM74_4200 [Myxococcaceae bacterium]|nr:hypothetical protein [Myxococcaceae bacterium]
MRLRTLGLTSSLGLSMCVASLALGACLLPDEHPASVVSPGPSGEGGVVEGGLQDAPSPPGQATQKGRIIDLDSKAGVEGATVDLGGKTGVTGDKGAYAIQVPLDTNFFMSVTGPGHLKLIEQEWKLTGDFDRSTTSFIPTSTSDTLRSTLPGYDATKATISVGLVITGACTTEGGATIEIVPPGAAKMKYFRGGFPSTADTVSVAGETTPTAVFWNVEPCDDYTIKVTHPTCTVIPFPYTDGPITYSGRARGEAGDAASFARVFLK